MVPINYSFFLLQLRRKSNEACICACLLVQRSNVTKDALVHSKKDMFDYITVKGLIFMCGAYVWKGTTQMGA